MAKKDKEKVKVTELDSEHSEPKKEVESSTKADPVKHRPYIHIDTFLKTAVPLFKMNKMQAQGFKARMNGRHYQKDEQVFLQELKDYLNIKD